MGKSFKSQWEFGDLFPPEQPKRNVLSVAELTAQIRRNLEKAFAQVWVSGEITNLKLQSSGHIYFTLKDATAQVGCVVFRGETQVERSVLEDGQKVVARGDITVYEPRGQYQLRVQFVERQGLGALQAAFEQLKRKLNAEGLFAPERKRPLPRFPRRIGVVTSPTGAAIRDVVHVVRRRNPALELLITPCRVQGLGAGIEIAAAIHLLNSYHAGRTAAGDRFGGLDAILVTRGGGSLEDLWAFNEEVVARAIFHSALPVVSAVGHEIDFTIADFVADLRAATPTAAGEILTEGAFSSCQFVAQATRRIKHLALQRLGGMADALSQAQQRLRREHPRRRMETHAQHLDELRGSLRNCALHTLRNHRGAWQGLSTRLARVRPQAVIARWAESLRRSLAILRSTPGKLLQSRAGRLSELQARLRLLGPEQVLARGYSITMNAKTGTVLRDSGSVEDGALLRTRLAQGEILSRTPRRRRAKSAPGGTAAAQT